MKLLKLEMQGFESYAKKTTVDFSAMNGLWLITGPTGARKTTIFDAVTYALFGESSGGERSANGMSSGYAGPAEKTVVTLEFEHQGRIWTVTRNPEYTRAKEKGEGETKETAGATLVCGEESFRKIGEVNKRISGMLGGISADQFRQLAMIAQNKFEKLLKANSNEQSKLLSQLLDTARFGRLTDLLAELRKQLDKEAGTEKARLDEVFGQFCWDDADTQSEAVNTVTGSLARGMALQPDENVLQAMEAQLAHNLQALDGHQAQLKPLEERVQELTRHLGSAQQIHSRYLSMWQLQETVKSEEQLLPEKQAEQARQARAQAAFSLKQPIDDAQRTQRAVSTAEEQVSQAALQQQEAKAQAEQAREAAKAVPQHQATLDQIKKDLAGLEEQLKKSRQADEAGKQARTAAVTAEGTKKQSNELNGTLAQHKAEKARLQPLADMLAARTAARVNAEQAVQNANERMRALKALKDEEQQDADDAAQQFNLEQACTMAIALARQATDRHQDLQEAYFADMAGQVARDQLKEGCPCPVCGSLTHPRPHVLSPNSVTRRDVDAALADVNRANEQEKKAANALEGCKSRREQHMEQIRRQRAELGVTGSTATALSDAMQDLGKVQVLLEQAAADLTLAEAAVRSVNQLTEEIDQANASLQQLNTRYADEHAEAQRLKARYEALLADVTGSPDQLRTRQAGLMAESSRLDQLICKLNEDSNSAGNLEAQTTASLKERAEILAQARAEAEQCAAALMNALQEKGFTHEEALQLMQLYGSQEQLTRQMNALTGWFTAHEGNVKQLQKEQQELVDTPDQDPAGIQSLLDEAKLKQQTALERKQQLQMRLQQNTQSLQNTKKYLFAYTAASEKLNRVIRLYHFISGKQGGGYSSSLPFETYIQRAYFQQVLHYANEHLARMTGGTLSLLMNCGGNGMKDDGLNLYVLSTETGMHDASALSGGESFKASLALALGLSEMVSGVVSNVDLGILFIDEGFGTLDENSLNQAMDVLDTISQERSRLVAIISHRPEMKQRIRNQLQVSKDGNGSHINIQQV